MATMEEKEEADRKMVERLGRDHDEDIWALINAHKQVRQDEYGAAIPWYETNPELDEDLRGLGVTLVPWKEPVPEKSAEVFYGVKRLGLTVPFQLPVNEVSPYSIRMIKEIMHFNHVKKVMDSCGPGTFEFIGESEARGCWPDITIEDVGAALGLSTEGALPHLTHPKYAGSRIQHLFKTPSHHGWYTYSVGSLIDDKLKTLLPALAAFFIPSADYGLLKKVPNWVYKYVTDALDGKQTNLARIVHNVFVTSCKHLQQHPHGKGETRTRVAPVLFPIYARKGWLTILEFEWYVKARARIRQILREKKVEGDWRVILHSLKPSEDFEQAKEAQKRLSQKHTRIPHDLSVLAQRNVWEPQSIPSRPRSRRVGRQPSIGTGSGVGGISTMKARQLVSATSRWQGRLRSVTQGGPSGASARDGQKSLSPASGKRGRPQDLDGPNVAGKRIRELETAPNTFQEAEKDEGPDVEVIECPSGKPIRKTRALQSILEGAKVSMSDTLQLGASSTKEEQTEADALVGQTVEHESAGLVLAPSSVKPAADILEQQDMGVHPETPSTQSGPLGEPVQHAQVEDQVMVQVDTAEEDSDVEVIERPSEMPTRRCRALESRLEEKEVCMSDMLGDMLGVPSIKEEHTEADTFVGQSAEDESAGLPIVPSSVEPDADILGQQNMGGHSETPSSIQLSPLGESVQQVEDQLMVDTAEDDSDVEVIERPSEMPTRRYRALESRLEGQKACMSDTLGAPSIKEEHTEADTSTFVGPRAEDESAWLASVLAFVEPAVDVLGQQNIGGHSDSESPSIQSGPSGESVPHAQVEDQVMVQVDTAEEDSDVEVIEGPSGMPTRRCRASESSLEGKKVCMSETLGAPSVKEEHTETKSDTFVRQRVEDESVRLASVPAPVEPAADVSGQQNIGGHSESPSIQSGPLGKLVQPVEDQMMLDTASAKVGTLGSHRVENQVENQLNSTSANCQPDLDTSNVGGNMRAVMDQSRDQLTVASAESGFIDKVVVCRAGDQSDSASSPLGTLGGQTVDYHSDLAFASQGTSGVQTDGDQADSASVHRQLGTLGSQGAGGQQELLSAQPDTSVLQRLPENQRESASGAQAKYEAMQGDIALNLKSAWNLQHTFSDTAQHFLEKVTAAAESSMTAIGNIKEMEAAWRAEKAKLEIEVSTWQSKALDNDGIIKETEATWRAEKVKLESEVSTWQSKALQNDDKIKEMEAAWRAEKVKSENEVSMWQSKASENDGNIKEMEAAWGAEKAKLESKVFLWQSKASEDDGNIKEMEAAWGAEKAKLESKTRSLKNQVNHLQHCEGTVRADRDRLMGFRELFSSQKAAENLIKDREGLREKLTMTTKALGVEVHKREIQRKCLLQMKVERDRWIVFRDLFSTKAEADILVQEREDLRRLLVNTETALGDEESKAANLMQEVRVLQAELKRARSASVSRGAG